MKDVQNAMKHLREHVDFPATKDELVAACDNLSDFSDEDKAWFETNLPEGVYDTPEDVMQAAGMIDPAAQLL